MRAFQELGMSDKKHRNKSNHVRCTFYTMSNYGSQFLAASFIRLLVFPLILFYFHFNQEIISSSVIMCLYHLSTWFFIIYLLISVRYRAIVSVGSFSISLTRRDDARIPLKFIEFAGIQ